VEAQWRKFEAQFSEQGEAPAFSQFAQHSYLEVTAVSGCDELYEAGEQHTVSEQHSIDFQRMTLQIVRSEKRTLASGASLTTPAERSTLPLYR